jgi:hypothetical protein
MKETLKQGISLNKTIYLLQKLILDFTSLACEKESLEFIFSQKRIEPGEIFGENLVPSPKLQSVLEEFGFCSFQEMFEFFVKDRYGGIRALPIDRFVSFSEGLDRKASSEREYILEDVFIKSLDMPYENNFSESERREINRKIFGGTLCCSSFSIIVNASLISLIREERLIMFLRDFFMITKNEAAFIIKPRRQVFSHYFPFSLR